MFLVKEPPPKIHCLREGHGRDLTTEVFVLYEKSQTFQLLHQANAVLPPPAQILRGCIDRTQSFARYSVSEKKYWSILSKLERLSVDVWPPSQVGFDGESYRLWLRNGYSESSFAWWCECPPTWNELGAVFNEIVALTNV